MSANAPLAPRHLSYSQLSSYAGCSERYRLERLHKVSNNTWWTTLMGSAIHELTEEVETQRWLGMLGDDPMDYGKLFKDRLAGLVEAEDREIKASGKKLVNRSPSGGPNKKDREWVEHYGPIYLERYFNWTKENGLNLAEVNGLPAVEVPFHFEVTNTEGEVITLLGSIDRVYSRWGRKGLVVVDLKMGEVPVGTLQLATYAVALQVQYGLEASQGLFWAPHLGATGTGKKRVESPIGGTSEPVDLRKWDMSLLTTAYFNARRGIDAGVFIPTITQQCKGCGVRDYCWGWSGSDALPTDYIKEHE